MTVRGPFRSRAANLGKSVVFAPLRALFILFAIPINFIAAVWVALVGLTVSVLADHWTSRLLPFPINRVLVVVPVLVLAAWYCSVSAARVVLRLAPPRARGVRFGCLAILVLLLWFHFGLGLLDSVQHPTPFDRPGLPASWFVWACIAAMLIRVSLQHSSVLGYGQGRDILFLRRFGGFADRAVIGFLLRRLAPGLRLVMLRPPKSGLGDWDPVTIAISGLKFRSSQTSMPVYLRSRDRDWQTDVRALIARSRAIIVDVSELTAAVRIELELLERENATHKVLRIADSSARGSLATASAPVVFYDKSLLAGLPRLAATLVFVVAIFLLDANLRTVVPWIRSYASWLSFPLNDEVMQGGSFVYVIPLLSILFRRSLTRISRRELAGGLQMLLGGADTRRAANR